MRKYRIPVNEGIVKSELEYEVAQLGLNVRSRVIAGPLVWRQHAQGVD